MRHLLYKTVPGTDVLARGSMHQYGNTDVERGNAMMVLRKTCMTLYPGRRHVARDFSRAASRAATSAPQRGYPRHVDEVSMKV